MTCRILWSDESCVDMINKYSIRSFRSRSYMSLLTPYTSYLSNLTHSIQVPSLACSRLFLPFKARVTRMYCVSIARSSSEFRLILRASDLSLH